MDGIFLLTERELIAVIPALTLRIACLRREAGIMFDEADERATQAEMALLEDLLTRMGTQKDTP